MTDSNKRSEQTAQKKPISKKKSKKKAKKKAKKKTSNRNKPRTVAVFEPKDEAEKIKGEPFTPQEELYCIAYTGQARGNKSKAARMAGYANATSKVGIYEIHRYPYMLKRIELLVAELAEELKMSSNDIEAEWGAIARFDVRNLFDEYGNLLDAEDLDTATARAVSSIKIRKEIEQTGKVKKHVADIIEVKMNDKNSALSNYARSLGMFKDTVIVDPSESMQKILEKINGTSLGPPALRSGKNKED